MFNLKNKNILITGATGYLGKEMAIALAKQGATVFINSRSKTNAQELVNDIKNNGFKAIEASFDITNNESIESWIKKLKTNRFHGLINNAYSGKPGSIETSNEDDFRSSYEITVVSAQKLFKSLLPFFREATSRQELVSIINVSSMYGFVSPDLKVYKEKKLANPPFYGASKAALHQWSKYGACEFSSEGIRFNTLSPGPFPNKEVQEKNPEFIHKLANKVPMGRVGRSNEIGGPVVFLISDESSFINGANLEVNGGWTCW